MDNPGVVIQLHPNGGLKVEGIGVPPEEIIPVLVAAWTEVLRDQVTKRAIQDMVPVVRMEVARATNPNARPSGNQRGNLLLPR